MTGQVARLGVFGGAFDPPHLTHFELARVGIAQLQLDQLRIVPTGDAWHKTRQLSSAHHRLAMARLAFDSMPQVVVDDQETRRNGPSYTLDTLLALQRNFAQTQLFLLIGGDQARSFMRWHQAHEILACATICVAERQESTGAIAPFDAETAFNVRFVRIKLPLSGLSASQVRAQVANHQSIDALVGTPVARYIASHHLYQTS